MVVYALHYALRDIQIISQYQVGKYRIDAYLPSIKLAIEVDEQYHLSNIENDKLRQKYIEENEGCTFIRINVLENLYEQIDRIVEYIQEFNLPLWKHELPQKNDGEYSFAKKEKLENSGTFLFVENFRKKCQDIDLEISELKDDGASNGMLGFNIFFDGIVLQVISGVTKKIKFQVFDFDSNSILKAGITITNLIQNKYRNIVGYERGCSEGKALELLISIRNRIG